MHAPARPPAPLSLCSLPSDVLEHIAFRVATVDLLGPPRHLVSLLCTCRHIYSTLSINDNAYLYARIFRAKFDYRAAGRRMSEEASYSSGLAPQLTYYCRALGDIRRGDIDSPDITQAFWYAFAMCSENDGRNAAQLEWAGLFDCVERFIIEKLWSNRERCGGWPLEDVVNSLALWLYWFSMTEQRMASKTQEERERIMSLIRPYAIFGFRYPPFLAPDNHFFLPLNGTPEEYRELSTATPHGYYPLYREPRFCKHRLLHYSSDRSITLAEPLIGLVSKLLYVAFLEREPMNVDQYIPEDREAANLRGWVGMTRTDVRELAQTTAAKFVPRGDWDWRSQVRPEQGALEDARAWRHGATSPSALQENDWERWRGCSNPWDHTRTRGVTYTFGSLTGSWGGRFLDPGDADDYIEAIHSPDFSETLERPLRMHVVRALYFTLREHHCISPAIPLPPPLSAYDPLDEGIMTAFFPKHFTVCERGGFLKVATHGTAKEYVYETYRAGRPNSHNSVTCEMCAAEREADEDEPMNGHDEQVEDYVGPSVEDARRAAQNALGDSMDIDEFITRVGLDDSDTASMLSTSTSESTTTSSSGMTEITRVCSGILDIVITGETLPRHALAYGNFRYYGRVRSWDGLVVLVRAPAPSLAPLSPDPDHLDTYVLRGYLVGGTNLVGAWRHVTDSIHTIPLEGPFVVSKVAEATTSGAGAEAESVKIWSV
ncbi:hypothetical protein OH77DRAFT_1475866 [Trametes cingulata]|nr:hypothetical protein OH77DRAFT_1475866 [Trametes cingulata]